MVTRTRAHNSPAALWVDVLVGLRAHPARRVPLSFHRRSGTFCHSRAGLPTGHAVRTRWPGRCTAGRTVLAMGGRRRGRGRGRLVRAAVAAGVLVGGPAAPLAAAPEATAALAPPSAFAWGDNEFGQVGNGSKATPEFDSPLSVILPAAVRQVAASQDEFTSAALLVTGRVEVWGSNAFSEAGPAVPNPVLSPHL